VRVSVVIVNLNGDPFIFECLDGLARQVFQDFETIVVDNGSTDGSLEKIRKRFPGARLFELGANKGFACACCRGRRESAGEDLAVLNNDAVPEPGWLKAMVACIDSDPKLGAIACRVVNRNSGRLESGGIFAARNGLVYLNKPADEDKPSEVFGACGVAGLYRGRMLDQVGFYPEDFFIYYEDADLAHRAQRAGWKALYCPGAVVRHLGSETTTGMGIKNYYLPRNRLRTVVRNWELGAILANAPWIMAYESGSCIAGLLRSPGLALKARMDFLRMIPADLGARAKILATTAQGFKLDAWLSKSYPGMRELWSSRK